MDMGKGCIVTVLSWWATTTLSFILHAFWWKSTTPEFYLLHGSCLQFTIFIFSSGGLCWRSLNYACFAFDSLYESCDAFCTFILIGDAPRGAWTLSILWLVAPCRKETQYPGQLISLFHVNLNFPRRCPAVDWYLCSVDMDSRQIGGHDSDSSSTTLCTTSQKPHRHFPPRLAHYRDTTSSQSITDVADNDNLIHTPQPLSFPPARTSRIYSLSVINTRNMWHPSCRQEKNVSRREMNLSWCIFLFSLIHMDTRNACYHWQSILKERFRILYTSCTRFFVESKKRELIPQSVFYHKYEATTSS